MTSLPLDSSPRHGVYTGRTTNWPMVIAVTVAMIPLSLIGKESGANWSDGAFLVPMFLIAIVALLNVLSATNVRAAAGPNGFTIRWGLFGWPRCSYGLDEIEHAEVIELPWRLVSWGFWWTPKRTCCTVRGGPTVRLTLRNGRSVIVTVPDPDAAVAALREATANQGD